MENLGNFQPENRKIRTAGIQSKRFWGNLGAFNHTFKNSVVRSETGSHRLYTQFIHSRIFLSLFGTSLDRPTSPVLRGVEHLRAFGTTWENFAQTHCERDALPTELYPRL